MNRSKNEHFKGHLRRVHSSYRTNKSRGGGALTTETWQITVGEIPNTVTLISYSFDRKSSTYMVTPPSRENLMENDPLFDLWSKLNTRWGLCMVDIHDLCIFHPDTSRDCTGAPDQQFTDTCRKWTLQHKYEKFYLFGRKMNFF